MAMNLCLSLLVTFLLSLACIHETAATDIDSVLNEVQKSLTEVQGDTKTALEALDGLRNDLKSKPNRVGQASAVLGSVGSALIKLKSNNAVKVISGCLDIVSGIATTFGGPVGMGIGAVAAFVSSILSLFTGNAAKNSISSVIDAALKKHRDEELQGKANGAKRDFAESSAFIEILKKQAKLDKDDLTILASNVPIYKFSNLLGILESRIVQGAVTTDFTEARKTVDFILLYSQLVVMRETMLLDLSLLYRKPGTMDHIAAAVDNVNKVNKQSAKDALNFLHNLIAENALVGAVYHPIEHSETSKSILAYLKYFEIQDPANGLLPSKYRFENVYWKGYSICSESYMNNHMFRGCYGFTRRNVAVKTIDNGYYTMANRYKRHVYITKHKIGWAWGTIDKDPGPQGHMIFIPLKTGHYMISTKKWPNWFMYMESSAHGYIRSWQGNPGPQGQWKIIR